MLIFLITFILFKKYYKISSKKKINKKYIYYNIVATLLGQTKVIGEMQVKYNTQDYICGWFNLQ